MRIAIQSMLLAAGLVGSAVCLAQAPAGAPANATGQCKDGTYTTAASKKGACSGHQGVKDWYASEAGAGAAPSTKAPSTPGAPAAAPAPAPTPAPAAAAPAAPATKTAAAATAAPGGGPGKVWVNTKSKVYHCPGDQWYGKTKEGEYMSEADAKAKGYRADHNKACK